jgi:hypothetical protein
MAVDKAIDSTEFDSKLTTVADAIRTAGGTTATMSFPTGMVDAISSLSSGGGGTEELSALLKIFGCSDYEISVVQGDTQGLTRINIPITNETMKSSVRLILIPGTNSLFPANTVKKAPILRGPSLASVSGFFAYIWPNIPDGSYTKYKSTIMVFTNTIDSFSYTAGNSFTEDGTSFLFENNLLTICFDKFDELYYGEYSFDNIIGTKVLCMGGNVQ